MEEETTRQNDEHRRCTVEGKEETINTKEVKRMFENLDMKITVMERRLDHITSDQHNKEPEVIPTRTTQRSGMRWLPTCYNCRRRGHIAKNCWRPQEHDRRSFRRSRNQYHTYHQPRQHLYDQYQGQCRQQQPQYNQYQHYQQQEQQQQQQQQLRDDRFRVTRTPSNEQFPRFVPTRMLHGQQGGNQTSSDNAVYPPSGRIAPYF